MRVGRGEKVYHSGPSVSAFPDCRRQMRRRVGCIYPRSCSLATIDMAAGICSPRTLSELLRHVTHHAHWREGPRDSPLLARLGLRAGDIVRLRLGDIDWKEAGIRVAGKAVCQALLPLTQEIGDAIVT